MLLDEMREEVTGKKSYDVQVNKVQHDSEQRTTQNSLLYMLDEVREED